MQNVGLPGNDLDGNGYLTPDSQGHGLIVPSAPCTPGRVGRAGRDVYGMQTGHKPLVVVAEDRSRRAFALEKGETSRAR